MTHAILRDHGRKVEAFVGSTAHLEGLLHLYEENGSAFPCVTLEAALEMPEITDDMWQYAVERQPRYGRSLTRKGE